MGNSESSGSKCSPDQKPIKVTSQWNAIDLLTRKDTTEVVDKYVKKYRYKEVVCWVVVGLILVCLTLLTNWYYTYWLIGLYTILILIIGPSKHPGRFQKRIKIVDKDYEIVVKYRFNEVAVWSRPLKDKAKYETWRIIGSVFTFGLGEISRATAGSCNHWAFIARGTASGLEVLFVSLALLLASHLIGRSHPRTLYS